LNTCTHCNKEVPELTILVPEFNNIQVCYPCLKQLDDLLVEVGRQARVHEKALRQIAFNEWAGIVPIVPVQTSKLKGHNRHWWQRQYKQDKQNK
jgi:hypothetical protein